jgi:hypothetical protein
MAQLSSTQPSSAVVEVVERALKSTNKFIKWSYSIQQAEQWLQERSFRAKLALDITKAILKGKSLGIRLTHEEKQKAADIFASNIFDCLDWLLATFETGVQKDIDKLKVNLYRNLDIYIEALFLLKKKVETSEDLQHYKDTVKLIQCCIDSLIKKLSS